MSVKNNKQYSRVKTTKSNVAKTSGRSGFLLKKTRFNWKIAAVVGVVLVAVLGYLFVRLSSAASSNNSSTTTYSLTGSNVQILNGRKTPKSNGAVVVEDDSNHKLSIIIRKERNTSQKMEWCLTFYASAGVRMQGGYKLPNQNRVVKLNKSYSSTTGKTRDCFWLDPDINSNKEYVWFELVGGDSIAYAIGSSTLAAVQSNTAQKNTTTAPAPVNTGLCGGSNSFQQGSSGNCVKLIQQRLADLGYDPGLVDGAFGEKTFSAVKVFENKNSLTVDGVVDSGTWSVLFSANAARKQ